MDSASKISRSEWLKQKGFIPGQDPFEDTSLNAEQDFQLLLSQALVLSLQHQRLQERLTSTCLSRFIFGAQGSGKTTLRRWLHRYCDSYTVLEENVNKRVLAVEYVNHDDYDFLPENMTTSAHIDRIIPMIESALARIGHKVNLPKIDGAPRVRLERISSFCQQFHIKHICILVDSLDADSRRSFEQIIESIAGLASNNSLLQLPTVCFLFFLPQDCYPIAQGVFHLSKYDVQTLSYEPDELIKIVTQRLTTYIEPQNRSADSPLGVMFDDPEEAAEKFVDVGRKAHIRMMWKFGNAILDRFIRYIHDPTASEQAQIPSFIVEAAYNQIITEAIPNLRTDSPITNGQIQEVCALKARVVLPGECLPVIHALKKYANNVNLMNTLIMFEGRYANLREREYRRTLSDNELRSAHAQLVEDVIEFIDRLVNNLC